jgi:hypothetical protein
MIVWKPGTVAREIIARRQADILNRPAGSKSYRPGRVRLAYLSSHFVPGLRQAQSSRYLHLVPTGHGLFVFQSGSRPD